MRIGFAGLLAVLFIALKLTGHVAWSWLWVLAPIWLPAGVVLSIALGCLAMAALMAWRDEA